DYRISRKLGKIVGWIFQQEGHAVALLDICTSSGDKLNSLDRRGHRQRHTDLESRVVISRNCLKSQMLAVPDKRPLLLKGVEHPQVSIVQPVSGTDRQFYAVDHNRQTGARLLRRRQTVSRDVDLNRSSSYSLPAKCFGRDLDKRYQITPVQICRERSKVWEAYSQRLNRLPINWMMG